MCSCATVRPMKNAPETKIEHNEDKMAQNSAKILEVVKKELSQLKFSNSEKEITINKISEQLTHAQAALGMNYYERLEVPDSNLDAYVKTLEDDSKHLESQNEILKMQVDELNDEDRFNSFKQKILDEYTSNQRKKWYTILASLLVVVGMLVYFFPSSAFSLVKGIFMK